MSEFINDITQVSPNDLITDETSNLVTQELQNNIKYLFNLLSNNSTNTTQNTSENLLNYDNNGNKINSTGGNFDSFETKNSWTAIQDTLVSNDNTISNNNVNLLIYSGLPSTIESGATSNSWLERDFYIPQQLQGSGFIFAIKGTGLSSLPQYNELSQLNYCNASTVPGVLTVADDNSCILRYEDIIVQIIGATENVTVTKTLGPWPQFSMFYDSNSWGPAYRTIFIPFNVGLNTSSIKIKILRTVNGGAIALSNMLLIPLASPFDSYNFKNVDINELYDFTNNFYKVNSTTLNGRHVSQSGDLSKLSEVITKEQLLYISQYNKDVTFDWDQISGPRLIELNNTVIESSKINMFEFDPGFTRYLHFNTRTNGPSPGVCCISFNYSANPNENNGPISCPSSTVLDPNVIYPIANCSGGNCLSTFSNMHSYPNPLDYCNNVKLDIYYKTINPGDIANPDFSTFNKLSYLIAIPKYLIDGSRMGNFEIYYDFYKYINPVRGAITYFTISRDGANPLDTFTGNFLLGQCSIAVANPPDDIPNPGTYTIKPSTC